MRCLRCNGDTASECARCDGTGLEPTRKWATTMDDDFGLLPLDLQAMLEEPRQPIKLYYWGCEEDPHCYTTEDMDRRLPELLRKMVVADRLVLERAADEIERLRGDPKERRAV